MLAAFVTATATAAGMGRAAAGADMGVGVTLTGGLGRFMGGGCSDTVPVSEKAAVENTMVKESSNTGVLRKQVSRLKCS